MQPGGELATNSNYNVIFFSFKLERKIPLNTVVRFNQGQPDNVKDIKINEDGTYQVLNIISMNGSTISLSELPIGWHVFRLEYTTNPTTLSFYEDNGSWSLGRSIYELYTHTPSYRGPNSISTGYHVKVINASPTGSLSFSNLFSLKKIEFINCDFSNVTSLASMFSSSNSLTEVSLQDMDFSSVTSMNSMFSGVNCMRYINMHNIITRDLTSMTNFLSYVRGMQYADLRFDFKGANFSITQVRVPTIMFDDNCEVGSFSLGSESNTIVEIIGFPHANDNVDVSGSSKLSAEILLHIIEQLNEVTSTKTLTLGSTNISKLTADQIAIAQDKGWTVT